MSISLHVAGYCQNCPEFAPRLDTSILKLAEGDNIYCHDIYCIHNDKCQVLMEHLSKYPQLYKKLNVPTEEYLGKVEPNVKPTVEHVIDYGQYNTNPTNKKSGAVSLVDGHIDE